MTVRVLAYAKLNLSLRVDGLRPDGYHEIVSEVQTIDLADRLEFDLAGEGVSVDNDLALQGEDIVEQAAVALLRRKGSDRGVRIRVEKIIPAGAGLGGGSSDAAAVLRTLDRLTPPELPFDSLNEIGATLGSDVPLFLRGGRILMAGRGELVRQLPQEGMRCFVVLVPPVHCATRLIYARWDKLAPGTGKRSSGSGPVRGDNDLLRAALDVYPELLPYHDAMESLGAGCYGMSGSGSAFFAGFDRSEAAERARESLRTRFDLADVHVCRPTRVGHHVLEAP